MQRVTLYSSSRRAPARSGKDAPGPGAPAVPAAPTPATAEGTPASASATASRWRSMLARHDRSLLFVAGALVALLALVRVPGVAADTAQDHAAGHRRRGAAARSRPQPAAVVRGARLRDHPPLGRARARIRHPGTGRHREHRDRRRHRRRHRRQRHHPHQPARRRRRRPHRRRVRRRHGVRRRRRRRAARERSRGAAGQDDSRRPRRGDAALDRGPGARRRGGRGGLPVRHRPVGVGRRGLRPAARAPVAAKASAC